MALNNFIPTIWAGGILRNLNKSFVYAQDGIVNRDYEGDISGAGDTVKINSIGPVTVSTYTKNSTSVSLQTLSDAQTILAIDQSKYFAFQVDDVDKAQQKPKVMSEAMYEAGVSMANDADVFIAGLYTGVAAANIVGLGDDTTPLTGFVADPTLAYKYLVKMGVLLDVANVPNEDRWVIVPPWFHGCLQLDDRFVKAGTSKTDEVLRNGQVGEAAGFRILKSNNVPNTSATKYKIIGGYKGAISMANQIVSVEAYRPEAKFADAIKGLHVYGGKLVRPSGISVMTANNA